MRNWEFFYFTLLLPILPLIGFTAAGQEEFKLVSLYESQLLRLLARSQIIGSLPIAVSVPKQELPLVSSSVLAAESWLKANVIAQLPNARISTILVGRGVLCRSDNEQQWSLVLSSVKNLYYSLVRWELVEMIKVSVLFSSDCLNQTTQFSPRLGGDLVEDIVRPLLSFLQDCNLAYSVEPSTHFSYQPFDIGREIYAHQVALEKLGFSELRDIRLVREAKTASRKLSSLSFPSLPGQAQRKPRGIIPPIQFAPVPDTSFSFIPVASPSELPTNPPEMSATPLPHPGKFPSEAPAFPPNLSVPLAPSPMYSLPEAPPSTPFLPTLPPPLPCSAAGPPSEPGSGEVKVHLWCVAKPTVPEEKLQEAMDYACGEGGADCEEIMLNGNCYYPNTLLAHASFAFNSYWQKMKHAGGSCSFDGTAVLVTSDPSFQKCHYVLS